MVDVDRGDHRHVGIEHVDGIESAADPHLQDRSIHPRRAEDVDGREGSELEVRQGNAAPGTVDPVESGHDCGVLDRLPVNPDAFVVAHEMRRGIGTGTRPPTR